jgi:hypothetical protein
MDLAPNTVLLYFEAAEADRLFPGDRHPRRLIKHMLRTMLSRRRMLGGEASFRRLVEALRICGYPVRINDRQAALAHPEYPVGLHGWPHVLQYWDLPNPAIVGGMFDHPGECPRLMEDPRYRKYIVRTDWTADLFRPYYGDAVFRWYAGIDPAEWPDTRSEPKTFDVLVYDKILWNHDTTAQTVLQPVLDGLAQRNLRVRVLRYGRHNRKCFRRLLKQARAFVFVCEHDNQGGAIMEAMASGLPVLAWDPGWWLDPIRLRYSPEDVPASSVLPYFSAQCGERFESIDSYEPALDRFLARMPKYDPRGFVLTNLSLEGSGRLYAREYFALAAPGPAEPRR